MKWVEENDGFFIFGVGLTPLIWDLSFDYSTVKLIMEITYENKTT